MSDNIHTPLYPDGGEPTAVAFPPGIHGFAESGDEIGQGHGDGVTKIKSVLDM
jgi:hypothetical protein